MIPAASSGSYEGPESTLIVWGAFAAEIVGASSTAAGATSVARATTRVATRLRLGFKGGARRTREAFIGRPSSIRVHGEGSSGGGALRLLRNVGEEPRAADEWG